MKCRICSSKCFLIRKKIRNNINRNVYECTNCEVQFLEKNKDNLKKWYSGAYRKDHSSVIGDTKSNKAKNFYNLNLPLQHRRVKTYRKLLKKSDHVLDIGCSTGHWLESIKPYVTKVYGLELNNDHARFVKNKLKIECFNDEIKKYNVKNRFDLITFFQVFEHIAEPIEFLLEVKEKLKNNGRLIIEVPNLNDPVIYFDQNKNYKDFYYRRPHEFYYDKKSLKYVLNKVGLKGEIKGIHRYNFSNLVNWHINGNTQASSSVAMAEYPINVNDKSFMRLISENEERYKSYLEKNLKSESLYFYGKFT